MKPLAFIGRTATDAVEDAAIARYVRRRRSGRAWLWRGLVAVSAGVFFASAFNAWAGWLR
jgi:hypothetical protein